MWGWGWFSMEQRRHRGTPQHTPVPMGKASRGWGQALCITAWWEAEREWHLLKLERFRLETRNQTQNPCEDHEALEWLAQRGCGIHEPGGQPSRPEWPQPRASRSIFIVDPALSQWLDKRPPQSPCSRSGSVVRWLV